MINPPVSARRERTRERLLDAAVQVFARVGFGAASVEAIAEAAGFTRGAFYSNFESKEHLFLALTDRQFREQVVALEAAVASVGADVVHDRHVDRSAIRTVLALVTEGKAPGARWHLVGVEFELLAMRDPAVAAAWRDQQRTMRTELAEALTRLLARVGLRFAVAADVAVDLLLGTYEAAARDAYVVGRDTPDPRTLETLVDLVITEA
ncbi:TetR/AcrR family transcriptional regulator [Xylanimonas protaetiae]|uniref:TetR/AcrR family transcriptional regulator n=1 Tax=Xylanimonas protaetiae TaxID=2509457 RepID=A0A4P6F2I3_9MICO|nr:TetR/AcrR family transcriptional regulator [Xylanimonas protaetiae]QAY69375.1 TetR/AcrR family transcriptional regulator [Xylanimonas protaetiae]